MFQFPLIFIALPTFFSSFERLEQLMEGFRVAANEGDGPGLKHLVRWIILQAGEVGLLRFAAHLI